MKKFATKDIISIVLPAVMVLSCCLFVFWLAAVFATENAIPDESLRPIPIFDFLFGLLWALCFWSIPAFKKHLPIFAGVQWKGIHTVVSIKSAEIGYSFAVFTWMVMCGYWLATHPEDTSPWWLTVNVAPTGALFGSGFFPVLWAKRKEKLEVSQKH